MCVFMCVQNLLKQQFWFCRTQWSVTAEKRQHKTRAAKDERGELGPVGEKKCNSHITQTYYTAEKKGSYLNEENSFTD